MDYSLIISLTTGAGTLLYVIVVTFYFLTKTRKEKERKRHFFDALLQSLKVGALTNLEDIINIYKGTFNLSADDTSHKLRLGRFLREFIVQLLASKDDASTLVKWKEELTALIKENEISTPYADLPTAERNVLADLDIFIGNNNPDASKRKLTELAGMIQARNDDLKRIKKMNKRVMTIAVIGMVLTIASTLVAILKK